MLAIYRELDMSYVMHVMGRRTVLQVILSIFKPCTARVMGIVNRHMASSRMHRARIKRHGSVFPHGRGPGGVSIKLQNCGQIATCSIRNRLTISISEHEWVQSEGVGRVRVGSSVGLECIAMATTTRSAL